MRSNESEVEALMSTLRPLYPVAQGSVDKPAEVVRVAGFTFVRGECGPWQLKVDGES